MVHEIIRGGPLDTRVGGGGAMGFFSPQEKFVQQIGQKINFVLTTHAKK